MSSTATTAELRSTQILDAAVRVFAARGFHNARISDVAREAQVAYGLVYHYFPSKDDLLEQVFRRAWGHLSQGLERIRSDTSRSSDQAATQLASVVRLMLGSYRLDPDLVRVLVLEVTRSGHLGTQVDEISRGFELIEQIIFEGQQRGELRADLDPRTAAYLLWGAIDEIVTGWVFGTIPSDDAQLARAEHTIVAVVVGGMLNHPDR